jgi:uncharacterized protein (DUF1684 family)
MADRLRELQVLRTGDSVDYYDYDSRYRIENRYSKQKNRYNYQ